MKAYEKPMLYAEEFALVEHITSNCSPNVIGMATFHSLAEECGMKVNGDDGNNGIVFKTEDSCSFYQDPSAIDPNPSMNFICYQGLFTSNSVAFSS